MLLTFDRKFNMINIYSIYWGKIMENTRPFHITKAEDQIMNILWSVKEPLSQQQIVMVASDSGEMTFKERSIFTLLNGLMDKGMVQEAGFVRSGKTYARTFQPTMTRPEWYANAVYNSLDGKEANEFLHILRRLLKEEPTE